MELRTYLSIIARRKWIVIGLFVILLLATVVVVRVIPPKYSATSKLRVLTPRNGGTNYVDFNIYYATRLMNTYASLISSASIQNELMQTLKLADTPDVNATVIADSELIKITAQARDAATAAAIANTAADLLVTSSNSATDDARKAQETAFNQRFTTLDKDLNQARSVYKQLMVPYTQNNAVIAGLNSQIDNDQRLYITLKDRYEQNVSLKTVDSGELATLNTEIQTLKTQIDQEKAKLDGLNATAADNAVQISSAQGEITLKEQEYTNLINQLDQLNTIQSVQGTNTLEVVDQAQPPTSSTVPNMTLIYILGPVISLFVAVLFAFMVDNLDDTLYSSAQIESAIQTTILGKIAPLKHPNQAIIANDELNYQGDVSRLQVNLRRISQGRVLRSLVISSTEPRVDESTLIVSLAKEYAKFGERVLVIDANLRMPSIHNHFYKLKNEDGLSQFLMGRTTIEQVIKDSGIPNLYVMTAGAMLNSPELFLGSEKMKGLLAQLEKTFAMVVVNVPPVLSVTDADELVTYVDGVILAVERGRTRRGDLRSAVNHLVSLNAPFIGMVINRAEVDWNIRFYQRMPKGKKLPA